MNGYIPTIEDLFLREVYGDWVHTNDGGNLSGGIVDGAIWQDRWRDLSMIPAQCHDAPGGEMGRRFMRMMGTELRVIHKWKGNAEHFFVFHTVIMQQVNHMSSAQVIQCQIAKRLDV